MCNSLKYAKILEDAGLPRNQAEIHIQIISEVLEEELASKEDIRVLQADLKSLEAKFDNKLLHIEDKFEKLEYRLVFKLGSLMVVLFSGAIGAMSLIL